MFAGKDEPEVPGGNESEIFTTSRIPKDFHEQYGLEEGASVSITQCKSSTSQLL